MFIYILITILLTCLSPIRHKNKSVKVVFVCITSFLTLLAGFRGVGFDYYNYSVIVYKWNEGPPFEPAFELLLWLTRPIGNSLALLLPIALIAVPLKTSFIYKYSYFPFLSLLIYFHISFMLHDMGQCRYGLAMGLVLFAVSYLIEGKIKNFFVLVTLAVSFHYSALCVYPIYFINTIKISKNQFLLCLLSISILLSLNTIGFFLWIAEHIPILGVIYRIEVYTSGNPDDVNPNAVGINGSFAIRFLLLLLLYKLKDSITNTNYNSIFNFYLYGIFLYLTLGSVPEFSYRCSFYFRLLDIIIVPYIIHHAKSNFVRLIVFLSMIIYCSIGTYLGSPDDETFWADYAPYKTCL